MSDPVVEAAQRAGGGVSSMCHLVAVGAAREALKPIRELHRPVGPQGRRCCHTCWDSMGDYMRWPCTTARHLYTTEELS